VPVSVRADAAGERSATVCEGEIVGLVEEATLKPPSHAAAGLFGGLCLETGSGRLGTRAFLRQGSRRVRACCFACCAKNMRRGLKS
jgi:hypothetical protein